MRKVPRAKDVLNQLSVRPSKQRGQNFLIRPEIIGSIIEFGRPGSGEHLVEIGPGLGALTRELVKFGKVTAVEIEGGLCAELCRQFPEVEVINEDIRQFDISR